ncbi:MULTISPECIES: PIN domain-containing protein [unclassified Streptomyces]|uniref:PIN domain-containing protein n=1 Tax=unclassified Streptomyces TaxID=2593676 RepID=UPI002E2CA5F1|nr:PIN domain-containing protein [Streptomyces sp. NBC_00228]
MLITPLPGTNRDNLIEVLRGEQTKVINLRGRHFGSAYQALLAYLSWSSDAVRMLRGQIRAADIDRLVLTRRHGALLDGVGHLAGSDQQAFVNGIVGLELDERIEEFEKAIKEYTALTERWNPSRRILVPDTTLFIQHPEKIEHADFAALLGGGPEPVHVLVPMMVVDELDVLKETKDKRARWRAGYSLAVLDRVIREPGAVLHKANVGQDTDGDDPARGEVTVELLFDPPGHARLPNPDDEIVDRAVVAQALAGAPVTLVTYDTGQSTRGWAAELRVTKLRSDAGTGPEPAKA